MMVLMIHLPSMMCCCWLVNNPVKRPQPPTTITTEILLVSVRPLLFLAHQYCIVILSFLQKKEDGYYAGGVA